MQADRTIAGSVLCGADAAHTFRAVGLFANPDQQFTRNYNRASFLFQHALTENPLFELDKLAELATRFSEHRERLYFSSGRGTVQDRWNGDGGTGNSVAQAIASIAERDSLIMLKRVELDPEFGPLVQNLLSAIVDAVGPQMRDDVIIGRGTVLIASPHRITSYHLDADVNWLFQVRGDKTIHVYDQMDRTLVTNEELENYFAGDPNGAVFRENRIDDAIKYDLLAGRGVHIPCGAPHWAMNRDTPSVALSVNFDLKSMQRLGRIYRLNSRLRRIGVKPIGPGLLPWRDRLKLAALAGLDAVRHLRSW